MKLRPWNGNKGITLIALVITIVVLLILAGITIGALSGNNSIIDQAGNAKISAESAEEREIVEISATQAMGDSKNADVEEEYLEKYLQKNAGGREYQIFEEEGEFIVAFKERSYRVNNDGNVEKYVLIVDNSPGDIAKDKDGNTLNGTTKPFEIWSIEDLIVFVRSINEKNTFDGLTIKLMKNLDFNSNLSYNDYRTTEYDTYLGGDGSKELKEQLNEGGLGFKTANRYMEFKGTLDGQNKTIKNLYVNTIEKERGIFCATNNGTIKDLNIQNADINIGYNSGTICCTNKNIIQGINISGGIKCSATAAGCTVIGSICAVNAGTVKDVYSSMDVTGKDSTRRNAGICATNYGGTIERCISSGTIAGTYEAGGISGTNSGTIRECVNIGIISPLGGYSGPYGGISAVNSGTIEYCYNMKDVGISGYSSRGIAGIAGNNSENGVISNCYSIGNVFGQSKGGITNDNAGAIKNCFYVKKGNFEIQSSTSTGTIENSGEKTVDEMLGDSIINDLNTGLSTENKKYIKDTNKINEGYPILIWQNSKKND